jgi:hypothetical protein
MPNHEVTDLITDQEMVFARLVLSGTMTDRQAAEAAGLNPETAAYTRSKRRVLAYMIEQRAAVKKQQPVPQEAEGLHLQIISREQVLARLWEIAKLSPELTRNSVSAQIKALHMIVAIEGLIPVRRVAEKESAEPLPEPNVFRAPWLPNRQGEPAAKQTIPSFLSIQAEPAILDAQPAAAFGSNEFNEYNSARFSETLSTPAIDPAAAFSKKPEKP